MGDALAYVLRRFALKVVPRQKQPLDIYTATRADLAVLFEELGYNLGAEIGVARGVYSEALLQANEKLTLYSIDAWKTYRGYRDHTSQRKLNGFLDETRNRLQQYGRRSRIVQGWSLDVARRFRDGTFDFVYIDGNHGFDHVMQDIIEWARRVRSGGIVAGHDYVRRLPGPEAVGVVKAVHVYTDAHSISPLFTVGGADPDECRSWFWVRP